MVNHLRCPSISKKSTRKSHPPAPQEPRTEQTQIANLPFAPSLLKRSSWTSSRNWAMSSWCSKPEAASSLNRQLSPRKIMIILLAALLQIMISVTINHPSSKHRSWTSSYSANKVQMQLLHLLVQQCQHHRRSSNNNNETLWREWGRLADISLQIK